MKMPESETERTIATRTVTAGLGGASVGRVLAAPGGAVGAATAGAAATAVGAGRAGEVQASPTNARSTDPPSQRDRCITLPPGTTLPYSHPPRPGAARGAARRPPFYAREPPAATEPWPARRQPGRTERA